MIDLSGAVFGRLSVTSRAANKGSRVAWNCVCACGASVVVTTTHLRSGHTMSCGCLRPEAIADRNAREAKHGMWNTPEWNSWRGMIKRCHCATDKKYPLYGARGISVCDEWRGSFLLFFNHIGPKPSKRHSVDRIDTNRGYEPGNVRWATHEEQNNNRRSNVFVVVDGESMTIAQAARACNVTQRAVKYRHDKGIALSRQRCHG